MSKITASTCRKICEKLDELSFGFPKSFLGNDTGIIKRIFSEEDGQVFLSLDNTYQTIEQYATKEGISIEEANQRLESLAKKALIYKCHRDGKELFAPYPFVAGLLEWQVHRSDKAYLMHLCMYMVSSKFGKRMSQVMPFYRSVPRHPDETVEEGTKIEPYDNIDVILDRHTRFSVAPCICRKMFKMKPGNKCNHPSETCIETDEYAGFFIETGIGREISKEEARKIILDGEKDGRVINVTNSQEGENICSCCSCGCGMLWMKNHFKGPSGEIWSNYYAKWNPEKCVHCGMCKDACGFNYLKFSKEKVTIDTPNCLGCGLCAMKCKVGALKIVKKDENKLYVPPATYDDAMEIWRKETKKDYKKFK